MTSETVIPRDITVESGKTRTFAGGTFVNGWITIRGSGRLECSGNLQCLGMSLVNDAFLACQELTTNVLEVDRDPGGKAPTLEVTRIRARVVHHVHLTLRDLIEQDRVKADYIQHFGGELNPSWDYVRGSIPLAGQFYEERADDKPVIFETQLMQKALGAGKTIFRRMPPLVAPRGKLVVAAATRNAVVEELERWLAAHPGPQRATFDALAAEWTTKLAKLSAEARSDAMFVIKRALKSPKLAEQIEALRTAIGG